MYLFNTSATSMKHHNGKIVELICTIKEPDDTHDAEVLPMYVVRTADGETFEAFSDELGLPVSDDQDRNLALSPEAL